MEKNNSFFDKFFKLFPGYIFGLLGFTVGTLGIIIALLTSPEYIIWKESISLLGHDTGGIFLRIGLVISGLISLPYFIYLGRAVKDEHVNDLLRKIGTGIGIFCSICVSLAGIFSGVNEFISMLHGFFALCSWLGNIAIFIIFSFIMSKNPKFSKYPVYVGYIAAGILILYLIPFFTTNFCNYFDELCYSFGRTVYIVMPIFEWVVSFSILSWILFNSCYLWYNKI